MTKDSSPLAFAPRATDLPAGRAALAVAHPGHEVAIHHWVEIAQPRTFVLTDGSGHRVQGRLDLTANLLQELGAVPGVLFGRFADTEIYNALLKLDFQFFIALAEELAESLLKEEIDYVVGDALEGYNPGHDACRLLLNTAVALAERASGRARLNFDFTVGQPPGTCPEAQRAEPHWLHLDEAAFQRKVVAARENPYVSIELDLLLERWRLPIEVYRTECLRPVVRCDYHNEFTQEPPFYEQYGERQVAAGHYQRVLRYREHFLPLVDALDAHVAKKG